MSVTVRSHNLVITRKTVRPDGKVNIYATFTRAGIYYNVPFSTRALPPNDTVGFKMTPALADPLHSRDPIIVAAPGMPIVYVWDAPADGYAGINLNHWTIRLAYLDLFCCDEEEPEEPEEPTTGSGSPTPTTPPVVVPPPPPPPPTTQPPIPGGGGIPVTTPPTLPGAQFPYQPAPWQTPNYPWQTGGYYAPGGAFFGGFSSVPGGVNLGADGLYRDAEGNVVGSYVPPVVPPETYVYRPPAMVNPATVQRPPLASQPVTPAAAEPPLMVPEVGSSQTSVLGPINEPHEGIQYAASQVSLSDLFGLPATNGTMRVTAALFPDSAPADAKPILVVSVLNDTAVEIQGMTASVYVVDADGNQFQIAAAQALPPLPAYGFGGTTLCVNWLGFTQGGITLYITINSQTGQPIIAFQVPGVIQPPGTLPPVATVQNELPLSVTQEAGFLPAITSKFQGSRNAVGHDDFYVFTKTSDRVAIVVVAMPDALATGFQPVLKIFNTSDLENPIVEWERPFNVNDADRARHSIGWKDSVSLPVLDTDEPYLLQVVHKYPFWSRRWGFKVYLQEQVADLETSLSVEDGILAGSLTSAYGRQSLKILNSRTGAVLFVETDDLGAVEDVQLACRPTGDTLAVQTGDRLRIYRPGIGVRYLSTDLLGTVIL